jgi:small subunit ribosomal protein S19
MSRSTKKGPFVVAKLLARVIAQKERGKADPIKTWARACTITPDFVGQTFMVHNGKVHLKVFVTEEMVGHKLGEFAPTRQFRGHGQEKKETAGAAPPPPSR